MTARFRRAALGIALLVTVAIGSPEAQATTFAPLTIDQFTDASTYIVEGKVLEVWADLDPDSGLVWTRARISITETFKGPDRPTELVVSSAGGKIGDYEVYVPGAAVFSPDEEVFLFLSEKAGRITPVASFQGKYTIRRAPGERRTYARTWHASRNDTFDARFLPHPAPEHRLYLDELKQQVEDRLAVGWRGEPIPGFTPERLGELNTPERRLP